MNGQIVMWDISEYEERIKNPRGDHRDKDLFIVSIFTCDEPDEWFFDNVFIHFLAWLRRRELLSNTLHSFLCRVKHRTQPFRAHH